MSVNLDAIRERGMNPACEFLARGDFNDCANAGGGRGAPLSDWCKPCLVGRIQELEQSLQATRNALTGTQHVRDDYKARAVKAEADLKATKTALSAAANDAAAAEAESAAQEETNDRVVGDLKLFAAKANADADEDQARAVKAETGLVLAEKARRAEQVRANKAEAERDTLREALARIATNAEDWHGPEPDMGHVRALAVISTWSRAALTQGAGE